MHNRLNNNLNLFEVLYKFKERILLEFLLQLREQTTEYGITNLKGYVIGALKKKYFQKNI